MRLTLCLLTWNERKGCERDVPNLPLDQFEEVYAIDGGSTDGTIEYLRDQGVRVIPQEKPGYNQAYISAFSHATTDAVILYHPKGSIDPKAVLRMRPLFEKGCDLVIASRMIRGSHNEEDDGLFRPRKWFVLILAYITSLLWRREGPRIMDVLHGFRGMRRDRFFEIDPLAHGLSIDLEMVARGYKRKLRMVEFPTIERSRPFGDTHFKAFSTGKRLLAYLVRELSRKA